MRMEITKELAYQFDGSILTMPGKWYYTEPNYEAITTYKSV